MRTKIGCVALLAGMMGVVAGAEAESGAGVAGKRGLPRIICWLALLFIACTLVACATGPRVINHSFGFDIRDSVPRVEVLDYRYGDSKLPVHAPEWIVKEGKPMYFDGVSGSMLVGDYLYVNKSGTDHVFCNGCELHFSHYPDTSRPASRPCFSLCAL